MATHYCSKCGAFSYHRASFQPGGWACESCGHVDTRQHPHPPVRDLTDHGAAFAEMIPATASDPAPAHVGGGVYGLPNGELGVDLEAVEAAAFDDES